MSFPRYPAYKDSDVEWLGEVPEHWEVSPLKREFAVVGGSTPKSDMQDYWDGDIHWITPADLSRLQSFEITESIRTLTAEGLNSCGATMVPIGSVVVSTRAPIGSLGIAGIDLCTNQGCKALVPIDQISPRFTAYFLGIATEALNVRGRGATFLEISGDELGAFKATLPPYQEQVQIATFLDRETAKIDALITEQQRLIELLQEKRQAVISHAVTKGLNPDAPMKDSGVEWLGEVPEHWSLARLKHAAKEKVAGPYGASLTKSMYTGAGYRVYGQQQVIPDNFEEGDYYIDRDKYEEMKRYSVSPGDVLISVMGTVGKVAVVPDFVEPGIINPRLVRYHLRDLLIPRFAQKLLLSTPFQEKILLEAKGATMDGLNMHILGDLPLPVPPRVEQEAILDQLHRSLASFDAMSSSVEESILLLKERRSALISAAVTGQIDVRGLVPEAEAA